MLGVALNPMPAKTNGKFGQAPTTVVAGAFRRAWARAMDFGFGGRGMPDAAVGFSGDLGGANAQRALGQDRSHDASHRIFRAPGLVYDPPVLGHPLRRIRPAVAHYTREIPGWDTASSHTGR